MPRRRSDSIRTWARREKSAAARLANTAAGVAALGGRAGFIGQVAPDQLGEFYRHDLTAAGVEFTTACDGLRRPDRPIDGAGDAGRPPDDEHLPRCRAASAAERARRGRRSASAAILYLEGYLWDPEMPRYAMVRAIDVAREAGRKVAFTLVRHLLRRPSSRRLQRADRRAAGSTSFSPTRPRSRRWPALPHLETAIGVDQGQGRDARRHAQRAWSALRPSGGERARRSARSRSRSWSTRQALAICSRPAS